MTDQRDISDKRILARSPRKVEQSVYSQELDKKRGKHYILGMYDV